MGLKFSKLVDTLGEATEQRKAWEKTEEIAKKELIALDLSDGSYEGEKYILKVVTKISRILDTKMVYDFLGIDKFLQVVKVIKKELVKHMLESDIDKVSTEGDLSRAYSTDKRVKE